MTPVRGAEGKEFAPQALLTNSLWLGLGVSGTVTICLGSVFEEVRISGDD